MAQSTKKPSLPIGLYFTLRLLSEQKEFLEEKREIREFKTRQKITEDVCWNPSLYNRLKLALYLSISKY